MSEFSTSDKVQIKFFDTKEQHLAPLSAEDTEKLKTTGWDTGMGITLRMPSKREIIVTLSGSEVPKGVIIFASWSNEKSRQIKVGEEGILTGKFEDEYGKEYSFGANQKMSTIAGRIPDIKQLAIYENNEKIAEKERKYLIFNFPPPEPSRDISKN